LLVAALVAKGPTRAIAGEATSPFEALTLYFAATRDADAGQIGECIEATEKERALKAAYTRKLIAFRKLAQLAKSRFATDSGRLPSELSGFTNEGIDKLEKGLNASAVKVSGDHAQMPIGPVTLAFSHEQGRWRIDVTSFFHATNASAEWLRKREVHEARFAEAAELVTQGIDAGSYRSMAQMSAKFEEMISAALQSDRRGNSPTSFPSTQQAATNRGQN
jgi:hypothetical protein